MRLEQEVTEPRTAAVYRPGPDVQRVLHRALKLARLWGCCSTTRLVDAMGCSMDHALAAIGSMLERLELDGGTLHLGTFEISASLRELNGIDAEVAPHTQGYEGLHRAAAMVQEYMRETEPRLRAHGLGWNRWQSCTETVPQVYSGGPCAAGKRYAVSLRYCDLSGVDKVWGDLPRCHGATLLLGDGDGLDTLRAEMRESLDNYAPVTEQQPCDTLPLMAWRGEEVGA